MFDTSLEVKALVERWRKAYDTGRPHSSPECRPRPLSASPSYGIIAKYVTRSTSRLGVMLA